MHYTASSIYEFKVLKAHTAAAVLTRIFYRYTGIWRLIYEEWKTNLVILWQPLYPVKKLRTVPIQHIDAATSVNCQECPHYLSGEGCSTTAPRPPRDFRDPAISPPSYHYPRDHIIVSWLLMYDDNYIEHIRAMKSLRTTDNRQQTAQYQGLESDSAAIWQHLPTTIPPGTETPNAINAHWIEKRYWDFVIDICYKSDSYIVYTRTRRAGWVNMSTLSRTKTYMYRCSAMQWKEEA